MVTNFREICVKWYRLLLARHFTEESQGRNFIKKSAYSVAVLSAKRSGFLPFFFSDNEKVFNSLTITKQYEIGLGNLTFHKSNELNQNKSSPSLTIVFFVGENIAQLERSLDSIIHQTFNNFDIIIIGRETKDKTLENIIDAKKSSHTRIVNIKKDTKLVDVLNKIISELDTEYVTFLDCTGILQPDSIYLALTILNKEKFGIIYADEDSIESNNVRIEPFFKPNWSPHLALSKDYIGKFVIYKTDLLKSINGFDDSLTDCNEYDLLLRATEKSSRIHRIPRVLFSNFRDISESNNKKYKTAVQRQLNRKKISAIVETTEFGHKLIPKLEKTPLVSIIIPTKDNLSKLKRCLDSISRSTYENYEIIVISNSKNEETWKFLHATGHKILEYTEPFNFSKMNNFAIKHAKGEHLLFLNDDTEIITRDWLESMLLYSMQHDVGVVGSLLLFPKSVFYKSSIQHGGVSIGVAGPANHSFSYCHYKEKNYHNFDKVVRNVSAVTAACMMIRREVFDKVDGFDEDFAISFGDIDTCLRIRHLGYHIVYNPNVTVYHYESSTRGTLNPLSDDLLFITRWEDYIISGDEFYNPNLTHLARNFRTSPYFSQEPALSLLLEIYFFRTDLQQLFSDINDNNIIELIDWAATKGVSSDFTRTALLPYNKYYRDKCSKKVMPLAEIIYEFNHNIEWQRKFPEVFSGRYERLHDIIKQRTAGSV